MTLLAVGLALALTIRIDAAVDADLRSVRGTMSFDEAVALVDPLASLPIPADDRALLRTFPGRIDRGAVKWRRLDAYPNTVRFTTSLPERHGDVGWLRGRGLWANGGWYPQPVGVPLVASWDVHVSVPEGALGAINGDTGALRWRGSADRVALAVLADAVISEAAVRGGRIRLLEHRPAEPAALRRLASIVEGGWPLLAPPDVLVVEDLDLARLARAAPGMVYLSDRTFRLFPGLERYHAGIVRRALVHASLPMGDGWERELCATALSDAVPAPSPRRILGWFAWNPIVDALLTDGTLPFYDDLFGEAFGGPPGLWEALDPRIPGAAAARQLDDLRGPGTAEAFARLRLASDSLADTAEKMGIPAEIREAWRLPYPRGQDYAIAGGRIVRRAPAGAPAEVVRVEVDGAPLGAWIAGPGPAELPLAPAPRQVRVDPAGHTLQTDRGNDRWPSRWNVVATAGFYSLSPSQGNVDFEAALLFRRQGDTRWLWFGSVAHDAQDLGAIDLGVVRYLGPLVDRRRRQHRLYVSVGGALLDPSFRPTDSGAVALGGGVSYAWDTRTDDLFPRTGHRLGGGVTAGFVPGGGSAWTKVGVGGVKLWSPHPRFAFALRGAAGRASGDVEHRLLALGGAGDVRGIAEDAVLGTEEVSGSLELRTALLRNASVPLGFGWLSELQVSPGLDGGTSWRDGRPSSALAASLGVHTSTDMLGARPTFAGVTVAAPVWTEGFDTDGLQWYIDFNHSF